MVSAIPKNIVPEDTKPCQADPPSAALGADLLASLDNGEIATTAEESFHKKRWQEALPCLGELHQRGFRTPQLFLMLGITLHHLQRHEEAIAALRHVVASHPDDPYVVHHLAVSLLAQGRHREALACFDQVVSRVPDHAEALFFKGECLRALGQIDEAIATYSQAVTLHPSLHQALYNIGDLHRRHGRLEEAQHFFQQVLHVAPECADAACALGDLAFRSASYSEAQECFRLAITAAPHFAPAHHNLGLALQKLGERQQGLHHMAQAIRLGKECVPSWEGPTRVRIEVASCCNLRCRHCPTGVSYNKVPRTLMPMELFEVLLEQLTGLDTFQDGVLYLGGEPLLNRDLPRMIRLLRQQTKVERIFFNTNGMLLTEEICQELASSGVNAIQVSIDGRSPAENDAIRKGASYERIAENIRLLRRLAPNITVTIANTQIKQPGDPDEPEIPNFLRQNFPELFIQSNYAMHWPGLDQDASAMARACSSLLPPKHFCNKPFTELAVRANGDVVPCCYDLGSELVLGNIRENSLLKIWQGETISRLREILLADQIDQLPSLCQKCIVYTGAIPVQSA